MLDKVIKLLDPWVHSSLSMPRSLDVWCVDSKGKFFCFLPSRQARKTQQEIEVWLGMRSSSANLWAFKAFFSVLFCSPQVQ